MFSPYSGMCRCFRYPVTHHFQAPHRVDFWYVPIHNRYFASEVSEMINKAGFSNHKKLLRGTDYDWDEIIYNNPKIDPYIYGEGEMRFWITK